MAQKCDLKKKSGLNWFLVFYIKNYKYGISQTPPKLTQKLTLELVMGCFWLVWGSLW